MEKIRNYTNRVEVFLHSDAGQRFFNIAYSVGAAIVIWGALFKILHISGGNVLLCIGMGTEIVMFILTAFDRPPKDPDWDKIMPAIQGAPLSREVSELTIVDDSKSLPFSDSNRKYFDMMERISKQVEELQEVMTKETASYVDQLSELNRNLAGLNSIYELQLKNISGQLTSMDNLNTGLKKIKDMYDKSAEDSVRYCEETEKMTQYMKQINAVYANMLAAMSTPSKS